MNWASLIDDSGKLLVISLFQIYDFDPKWRSSNEEDWPKHDIQYSSEDFSKRKGKIIFIV